MEWRRHMWRAVLGLWVTALLLTVGMLRLYELKPEATPCSKGQSPKSAMVYGLALSESGGQLIERGLDLLKACRSHPGQGHEAEDRLFDQLAAGERLGVAERYVFGASFLSGWLGAEACRVATPRCDTSSVVPLVHVGILPTLLGRMAAEPDSAGGSHVSMG